MAGWVIWWVVLVTPWGVFDCPRITCQTNPEGMQGYWLTPVNERGVRLPGALLLTVQGRPFGLVECEAFERIEGGREEDQVWRCGE